MPGPGEYRPDPTEGINRIEDLPKPKLIFYICAPVFDVSPLLMGQESDRSDKHSATPHRIIPLKSRSETV